MAWFTCSAQLFRRLKIQRSSTATSMLGPASGRKVSRWFGSHGSTAFAACPESLASDAARSALVAASGTDTVTTRVFDVALGYPWPARYPERVLRNGFWERWEGHEDQLSADSDALSEFIAARERGDFGYIHIDAGQGVGDLTAVRAASEVIEQLCTGAADLLGRWTS